MARPSFIARHGVDDPGRLAAMIGGVAFFERRRPDHDCPGLGVERLCYFVGRTDLLGTDSFLFDQSYQWRGTEAQNRGAGSADFAAFPRTTFGFANRTL